jgi:hypothetical protein
MKRSQKLFCILGIKLGMFFEQFGAVTKYEIAKVLLTEFKELELLEPKKRKTWQSESHNMPIFDALSLGLTWFWIEV